MELRNLPAIVTGGASGLGEATARMLAAAGAKVALFDLNTQAGEALAAKIGGRFFNVDVTDEAAVNGALDEAEAAHGVAQVLVSCAGIGPPGKAVSKGEPLALAKFRQIVEVNLIGTFNVASKAAARMMQAPLLGEERGIIVNTSSVAAFDGQIGQPAYAASKGGIASLTLPMAREFAQSAIRVVTIAPGLFLTPLMMSLPEAARDSLGRQTPFPNRLGQPAEYARLVRAVIDNPMLNGEVIRLDGAIRMTPR